MPRAPSVYSDFFYGPLTEDVEELLVRFERTASVRFEEFSSIWRAASFSEVFFGIGSSGDARRFSAISLATAARFFLPPYSYQVRVGGLYLMFGFYHAQIFRPPAKIRLALKDWDHVQNFLRDSLKGRHYDVIYIYRKLLAAKAFHFTAMPHVLTFTKQQKAQTQEVHQWGLSRATVVQDLLSSDLLDEVSSVQNLYEKLKEATEEGRSKVSMIHRDFSSCLKDCVSQFMAWQQETTETRRDEQVQDLDSENRESSSRARLLSSIKNRSYTSVQEAPRSRRHRKLEVVDSSSSSVVPLVQEAGTPQKKKKRPVSLKARTQKRLEVTEERTAVQSWLLSAPEETTGVPMKRTDPGSRT